MKIAHVVSIENETIVQDLKDHLRHVAVLCREYMGQIDCPAMGYIVGILHDTGKAAHAFQDRMEAIRAGLPDPGQKGGHASAGAVILDRFGGEPDNPYKSFALQAMCEAIFSHHAALPDNISSQGEDGYRARLQCDETQLREIEEYFWEEIISREELDRLLRQAYEEAETLAKKILKFGGKESQERGFFLGMAEKMLLSALIDADWLDSAISGERMAPDFTEVLKAEADYGEGPGSRKRLFVYFLDNLEDRLGKMGRSAKPINVWRNYISDSCKEAGSREGGIYTLACPTGAGKTLAVTRFALAHCILQNKNRIFYIIPYLSVIDQAAKSIKAALGQGSRDELVENNILELHSQVERGQGKGALGQTSGERTEISSDGDFWAQRMAEPIVLTTMVRFLNTFFAQGTRNLRPAHHFQNAVIIFDEIQTLPVKQIALFNSLLNYLTAFCGCTCVLCTATQPLLGETSKPVYPVRMAAPAALAKLPREAWTVFKRVQVEVKLKNGGYTREELADFIWDKATGNGNVLAILNTRDAALAIYSEVTKKAEGVYKVFYLSTRLYAAHRKGIIENIRKALADREKIIVVSTQLIEAGVDFDFSCVVRSLAGMDSIVQAAGRCNREGLRGVETTYIVNPCAELESLVHLRDIKVGMESSERLLEEFKKHPNDFDGELLSEKAMHRYFAYYFWKRKEEMIYPVPELGNLYDLLACNSEWVKSGKKHKRYEIKALNQAFHTAAEHFSVIEDDGYSVFVPRGRGKKIWEEIQKNAKHRNGYGEIKNLLKETQQYVVNLRKYEIEKLGKEVVRWEDEMGMYVLNEMYYDENAGITGEISGTMPLYGFFE